VRRGADLQGSWRLNNNRDHSHESNGLLQLRFTPGEAGEWGVEARWPRDGNHEGSSSLLLSFTIEEAQPWWQRRWHLIAASAARAGARERALARPSWLSSSFKR